MSNSVFPEPEPELDPPPQPAAPTATAPRTRAMMTARIDSPLSSGMLRGGRVAGLGRRYEGVHEAEQEERDGADTREPDPPRCARSRRSLDEVRDVGEPVYADGRGDRRGHCGDDRKPAPAGAAGDQQEDSRDHGGNDGRLA